MRSLLAATVAALLLAACTSSGGTSSPSVDPGSGLSKDKAEAALLSQSEVGSGLKSAKVTGSGTPFPCRPNDPPLDKRVPPRVQVKATFAGTNDELAFSEEIDNYGDEATAVKALALGEKGFACKRGSIRHLAVAVQGPADLSKSITAKVDKVEAWSVSSQAAKVAIILAKIGAHLVVLTFGATAGADTSNEDAAGITQRALQKVTAAAG